VIQIENITVHAGSFRLRDVSLSVPSGSYGVLMGKTGCGKTTLLESVIGLKKTVSGAISLYGADVTNAKPALRGIGFVPQDGALFPNMTVHENLAFALTIRKRSRAEIEERVVELAGLLGLAHLLDRKPRGLSGGESQRVALGRALAARPRVLCLDEPMSSLDDETRREMCTLLKAVRARTGVTALHITHNLGEAVELADRVFRLDGGKIREVTQEIRQANGVG
jgi:ABC-type sugar transport system ATPase subunit